MNEHRVFKYDIIPANGITEVKTVEFADFTQGYRGCHLVINMYNFMSIMGLQMMASKGNSGWFSKFKDTLQRTCLRAGLREFGLRSAYQFGMYVNEHGETIEPEVGDFEG